MRRPVRVRHQKKRRPRACLASARGAMSFHCPFPGDSYSSVSALHAQVRRRDSPRGADPQDRPERAARHLARRGGGRAARVRDRRRDGAGASVQRRPQAGHGREEHGPGSVRGHLRGAGRMADDVRGGRRGIPARDAAACAALGGARRVGMANPRDAVKGSVLSVNGGRGYMRTRSLKRKLEEGIAFLARSQVEFRREPASTSRLSTKFEQLCTLFFGVISDEVQAVETCASNQEVAEIRASND